MDFGFDATNRGTARQAARLHGLPRLPGRARLRRPGRAAAASGDIWQRPAVIDDLKAEARKPGHVEPLPHQCARTRTRPREIAAKHGAGLTNLQYAPLAEITGRSGAHRPRGAELRRPRHRQHGAARRVRQRGADRALAAAAARGRDPLHVLHDRARRGLLRRDEHRDQDRARRRRVRDQRPQVVVIGRDGPALQAADRDGQDQPRRRTAPPAVHDLRAERHPGRERQAQHARLRLHRLHPRRPRRDRVQRRAGFPPRT